MRLLQPHRPVQLKSFMSRIALFLFLVSALAVPAQAYGPGCLYCTKEPTVATVNDPLLQVAMKWCGAEAAPTIVNPGLACRTDFKTVLWSRHERATDCIWVPQGRTTLRSGATASLASLPTFADLDTTIGMDGDIVFSPSPAELFQSFMACDNLWAGQPKGIVALNANRLIDDLGTPMARSLAIKGSIARPWLAVADTDNLCQLNERSLAHAVGHVLNLGHIDPAADPTNLMVSGGAGAKMTQVQVTAARLYLSANPGLGFAPDVTEGEETGDVVIDFIDDIDVGDPLTGPPGHLDISRLAVIDASAISQGFSIHLASEGLLPKNVDDLPIRYWIPLDTDNNATTGGQVSTLVPGFNMEGVEQIAEIEVDAFISLGEIFYFGIPNAYSYDDVSKSFKPLVVNPGDLTAEARNIDMVFDLLPGSEEPDTVPFFGEVAIGFSDALARRIKVSNFSRRMKGTSGSTQWPNGLRLQAGATDTANSTPPDMGPNAPEIMSFPFEPFPEMTVTPEEGFPGDTLTISVSGMTPTMMLGIYMGNFFIDPFTMSDIDGAATFEITIPAKMPIGPTLLSVGVQDPNNAVTTDGVVQILETPLFADGFESGDVSNWTSTSR